jgi:hypothetical protein
VVRIGLLILVASWVPLLVVGLLNPNSNPIGLVAWASSLIGIIVAASGLLLRAVRDAKGGGSAGKR